MNLWNDSDKGARPGSRVWPRGIAKGRPSVELTAPYGGMNRENLFHPDLAILAAAGFTVVETPSGAVVYLPGCADPERYA